MKLTTRKVRSTLLITGLWGLSSVAQAQTPATLYTWGPPGVEDWFRNFGAANTSATLSNPGGELRIVETSTAAGGSQAFCDGFNTIRDISALFPSGSAGGLDLTGLSSLEFVMGHNGVSPINVQFFTQASPGSTFVAFGPDVAVSPGINTYSLPLSGLTYDQQTYMRTIGVNIRDHAGQGNLTWTIQEVLSAGTPLSSRTIADHNGGAADFDGAIVNFDGAAVQGNTGQNNSGLSVVGGGLQWIDLEAAPAPRSPTATALKTAPDRLTPGPLISRIMSLPRFAWRPPAMKQRSACSFICKPARASAIKGRIPHLPSMELTMIWSFRCLGSTTGASSISAASICSAMPTTW